VAIDLRFKRSIPLDSKAVKFEFEGKTLVALESDTVASALLAHGIDYTRTTAVSDTPRAPFCMMGTCFECLMEINRVPNRQACLQRVTAGMVVRRMQGTRELDGA